MQKLYVLVRTNMPKNYQAVQAGHAVAEFTLQYPELWQNQTLIYLRVKDENELQDWADRLHEDYIIRTPFYEPDLNDEITALAVLSSPKVDDLLKDMKLV